MKPLYLFFLFPCFLSAVIASEIKSVEFIDPPNYKNSKVGNKPELLYNRQTSRLPIWTDPGGVAWTGKTLIEIELEIRGIRTSTGKGSLIRLHTGYRPSVGVDSPASVDVYSVQDTQFLGNFSIPPDAAAIGWDNWVSIGPLALKDGMVKIIIHTSGKVFALDEIEILETDDEPLVVPVSVRGEAREHSLNRIKEPPSLYAKAGSKQASAHCIRVLDAFSPIPDDAFSECMPAQGTVRFIDLQGNLDQVIVAVKAGPRPLTIDWSSAKVEISELTSIMAANGKSYWDPLLPIGSQTIKLAPHQIRLLWIQHRLSGAGGSLGSMQFDDGTVRASLKITSSVFPYGSKPCVPPYSNLWAYMEDKPIWKDSEKILEELKASGTNVYVIHPAAVRNNRLSAVIKQVKDFDQILVFNPDLLDYGPGELKKFLSMVTESFRSVGVDPSHWALYPMDEPMGGKIEGLVKVVQKIKTIDSNIRIYANPTTGKTFTTTVAQLKNLISVVDIVQPSQLLLNSVGDQIFRVKGEMFWMYGGPSSPTKAADPTEYRQLWIDAWLAGANGAGFWSFSDTSGSSAWNDYDGKRPDWSVVYESKGGVEPFISSRRWEAFKSGFEDFGLLKVSALVSKDNVIENRKRQVERLLVNKIEFMKVISSSQARESKCLM